MTAKNDLRLFFEPRSIALIGASSRTGPGSFNLFEQMRGSGFKGEIYPVNPRGGTLLGEKVYKSLSEIAAPVDLAVVFTPREVVPGVVRQCVEKGIRAVIIITQGFSDAVDETGRRMHREILDAIRGTSTRIIGPNTIGVVNNFNRFNTSFVPFMTELNGVGLICQSGIFLCAGLDLCGGLGMGVDVGNGADLGFVEMMEFMAQEPRIKVINIHMEGIADGRRFMRAARRTAAIKPVLVLKTGTSEEGARAAGSHSGSMAGEDDVYRAAFSQCGVIRVDDLSQMNDMNRALLTFREMRGKRVGVVTASGGAGIILVDCLKKYGLEIARYTQKTEEALHSVFHDWMKVGNPLDIWPASMSKGYAEIASVALENILSDEGVDAVVFSTGSFMPPEEDPINIIEVVEGIAAKYPHKPMAVWKNGPAKHLRPVKAQDCVHVVDYGSADDLACALAAFYRYHNEIKVRRYETDKPGENAAGSRMSRSAGECLKNGRPVLGKNALEALEVYGIPVVQSGLAKNVEEAVRLGDGIGYPVVMKISSPAIAHKSEVGGVITDIGSALELRQAYSAMMQNVSTAAPEAEIEGVLIQAQAPEGVEVIIGGKRDPQFGPVIVFGMGGIYTELIRDVAFRVAPVTRREALEMIRSTKAFQVLSGARGKKPGDIEGLAGCVVAAGSLLLENPAAAELDINPLLVGPKGCLALDARIMPAGKRE